MKSSCRTIDVIVVFFFSSLVWLAIAPPSAAECQGVITGTTYSFDEEAGEISFSVSPMCEDEEGELHCPENGIYAANVTFYNWHDNYPNWWYTRSHSCSDYWNGGIPVELSKSVKCSAWEPGTYEMKVKYNCCMSWDCCGGSSEHSIGFYTVDHTPQVALDLTWEPANNQFTATVDWSFPQTQATSTARDLRLIHFPSGYSMTLTSGECPGLYDADVYSGQCQVTLGRLCGVTEIKARATACGDNISEDTQTVSHPAGEDPWCNHLLVQPPNQQAFSCSGETDPVVGAPVLLTNGNMRYDDDDSLPTSNPLLSARFFDSKNGENGVFGRGWRSVFDARIIDLGDGVMRLAGEEGHSTYFIDDGSGQVFEQLWPSRGIAGGLTFDGVDTCVYSEPSGELRRTFSLAEDGRLVRLEVTASREVITVAYDASGVPSQVTAAVDGVQTWSWIFSGSLGRIDSISTLRGEWAYFYTGDLLTSVTIGGASRRTYSYDAAGRLVEVRNGANRLLETHEYYADDDPDHPGWALTSRVADEQITSIAYQVPEAMLDRPPNQAAGEIAARVTWSTGLSADYYLRPVAGGPYQTVEIRGICSCGSGDFTAFVFDWHGRLVRRQDARGYITTWEFDDDNRVTAVTEGLSPLGCDPASDPGLCRVASPDDLATLELDHASAVTTTFSYTDGDWPNRNRIASICRPSVLEEGGANCVTTSYDPTTGVELSSTMNGWTWHPDLQQPQAEQRTVTNPVYDGGEEAVFNPAAEAAAIGATLTYQSQWESWATLPQPAGYRKAVDGPLSGSGDQASFVYYPYHLDVPDRLRGKLAATMSSLGEVTFFDDYDGYDPHGVLDRVVDSSGVATTYRRKPTGFLDIKRLLGQPGCDTSADPLCAQDLRTVWGPMGVTGMQVAYLNTPLGRRTEWYFDRWQRPYMRVRCEAHPWVVAADKYYTPLADDTGLPLTEVYGYRDRQGGPGDISVSWTDLVHDARGRLTRKTYRYTDNGVEEYEYDAAGNLVAVKEPDFTSANIEYTYDAHGNLVEVRQLADAGQGTWLTTSYSYDAAGNVTAISDANGNVTSYIVDDFGQTCQVTSPVTGVTKMRYDKAGRLYWREDARGAIEIRSYDAAGQLLQVNSELGGQQETVTYTYQNGRLTSATGGGICESWTYDRRGLPISYSRDGETLRFFYNADGDLISQQRGPCERIDYTYDHGGRPRSLTVTPSDCSEPIEIVSDAFYNPYGPPLDMTRAGGLTQVWQFDRKLRMTGTQLHQGPTTLLDRSYTYDLADNLVTRTNNLDAARNRTDSYDDLGRLLGASGPFGSYDAFSYEYDAIGSRTRRLLTGPGTSRDEVYSYLGSTPLLQSIAVSVDGGPPLVEILSFDPAGNLTADGTSSFDYSPRNRLTRVHQGGSEFSFGFDAAGLRTSTWDGVSTSIDHYLLPDGRPFLERFFDGSSITELTYLYLESTLVALLPVVDGVAGPPLQVVVDPSGFPLATYDSDGSLLWEAEALPFGEIATVVGGSADGDPWQRFPGQWEVPGLEAAGLSHLLSNGHRWYRPDWGSHTQADPLRRDGDQNPYAFAQGNPGRFLDTGGSGLQNDNVVGLLRARMTPRLTNEYTVEHVACRWTTGQPRRDLQIGARTGTPSRSGHSGVGPQPGFVINHPGPSNTSGGRPSHVNRRDPRPMSQQPASIFSRMRKIRHSDCECIVIFRLESVPQFPVNAGRSQEP